jgi:hypothetical protein
MKFLLGRAKRGIIRLLNETGFRDDRFVKWTAASNTQCSTSQKMSNAVNTALAWTGLTEKEKLVCSVRANELQPVQQTYCEAYDGAECLQQPRALPPHTRFPVDKMLPGWYLVENEWLGFTPRHTKRQYRRLESVLPGPGWHAARNWHSTSQLTCFVGKFPL